jgi:hypothetical protein
MKEEKIECSSGSICGGIIKESEFMRRIKNNAVEEVMMAYVLPDKWYDKYHKAVAEGKERIAHRIFMKHAWSMI